MNKMREMEEKLRWMTLTFERKEKLDEKIRRTFDPVVWKFKNLRELKKLNAIKPEEESKVLETLTKNLESFSDEELYYAIEIGHSDSLERKNIAKEILAKRMKKWDMRSLLSAIKNFHLEELAKEIIIQRTLLKYKDDEEALKIAAAKKDRRTSLPAQLVLKRKAEIKAKDIYEILNYF